VEVNYKEERLIVNGKTVAIPPVFDLNLPCCEGLRRAQKNNDRNSSTHTKI